MARRNKYIIEFEKSLNEFVEELKQYVSNHLVIN